MPFIKRDTGVVHFTNLDATGWDDMRIVPGAFSFAGSSDPNLNTWQPGGSGATFVIYEFTNNDQAFFSCQLPHTYKEGTDLKAHVHWTPRDRGVLESGNTVAWKLDYSIISVGGVFLASTTVDMTDTCTGTDDFHEISPSVTISGTGLTVSAMLIGRIYRDTGDTWATNTVGERPAFLEIDFHYQLDTPLGSNNETSKDDYT